MRETRLEISRQLGFTCSFSCVVPNGNANSCSFVVMMLSSSPVVSPEVLLQVKLYGLIVIPARPVV